ncbi:hypothetical protein EVAR_3933_1 [Eumeta japonica]|uniref:Uncharacterized protein n=1 Tax=Eumeta variegata TaxID=151549 RepID=A0A4C1SRP7_EUMVA|nr:hypothetical protein EVAR_3933_1 [Eumeta japonica]
MLQQLSDESPNAGLSNGIERNVLGVKKRDKIQLERINVKTKFRKVQTVQKIKMAMDGTYAEKGRKMEQILQMVSQGSNRSKGRQERNDGDDLKNVGHYGYVNRNRVEGSSRRPLSKDKLTRRGEKTGCRK